MAGAAISNTAKKAATAAKFWAKHREAVLAAEADLEAAGGDLTKLTNAALKALVTSRTGRISKAKVKNEGELPAEVIAALGASDTTIMPEVVSPALAGIGSSVVARCCPSCDMMLVAGLPAPDENGHIWCDECGGALSGDESAPEI